VLPFDTSDRRNIDESARAYELVKIFHQENPEKPRDPEFSENDEEEGGD
jgi:hypothetical protein